ncbi:MAG: hypothetical protein G01um101416_85 [Microgenomates group bacterium Gr01-1014_16]|nr:MAG: hypothetical protein G01um101416_85 [Microgenomates group bacterium Gr01-1014_16]
MLKEAENLVRQTNGDMEMLFPLNGGTFQAEWEHSYGNDVFNPSPEHFSDFVHGRTRIKRGEHKLLFGVTLNGVCPADCLDCPFGRTIMAKLYELETNRKLTLARPITPPELQSALKEAHKIGVEQDILTPEESFSAGALLAGDPSYSPHIAELIATVAQIPGCDSCRWSTIAADTLYNVLEAFRLGAVKANVANPNHTANFQVSVHSTNHALRVQHTGVTRLLPLEEIARAAKNLHGITGRKMSLSFVLHAGSVIDPEELNRTFSPDDTIISLRPIYSSTTHPIDPNRLIALYSRLRNDGRDVVYMPPSQDGTIDGRPIELHNMRSQSLGL